VKFGALAIDFDGTIAAQGRVSDGVRAALAEVRERGVVVSW
jgi:hydroxymethylpyrimidine pyrophosphatase-like HAD family hydrolase